MSPVFMHTGTRKNAGRGLRVPGARVMRYRGLAIWITDRYRSVSVILRI